MASLPADLAEALDESYREVVDHYMLDEWDDAQVDAGHFCEAALRYLEFKMTGKYPRIGAKKGPNRKVVVRDAEQDTSLEPSLRAQVPQALEIVMDFRNNRNAAHLGDIDANLMDGACVLQMVSWVVGEVVRIETQAAPAEVQGLLDSLAVRPIPTIQTINGQPIILDRPNLTHSDKTLIYLLHAGPSSPVPIATLRGWTGYGNSTQFRTKLLSKVEKATLVHIDKDGMVHLLRPGQREAERLILDR